MKKIVSIILACSMALSFAACGNSINNSSTDSGSTSSYTKKDTPKTDIQPADIEKRISDAVGSDNYLCDTDISKDELETMYQLDMSKVKSFVAKQNSIPSVNMDIVIVLQTADDYAKEAAQILNERYAQTVDYIRQYPFGTQKVLNARLYVSGNTVIYVIAGKTADDSASSEDELILAKEEYGKIDAAIKDELGELPDNSAVVPEEDSGDNGGLLMEE